MSPTMCPTIRHNVLRSALYSAQTMQAITAMFSIPCTWFQDKDIDVFRVLVRFPWRTSSWQDRVQWSQARMQTVQLVEPENVSRKLERVKIAKESFGNFILANIPDIQTVVCFLMNVMNLKCSRSVFNKIILHSYNIAELRGIIHMSLTLSFIKHLEFKFNCFNRAAIGEYCWHTFFWLRPVPTNCWHVLIKWCIQL